MKRLLYCLIMLPAFGAFSQSRTPLTDAIDYCEALEKNNGELALNILRKYDSDLSEIQNNVLIENLDSNDFKTNVDSPEMGEPQSGAGSVQGLLIDAIGTVIADRFREELTLAFLEDFRSKLEVDSLLGNIFPSTRSILLYSDPFNYKVWMSSFRVAMEKDLHNIPSNLPYLIEAFGANSGLTDKQKKYIEDAVSFYPLIKVLWENPSGSNKVVVQGIEKLENYATSPEVKNSLSFSKMVVDGLSQDGESWVKKTDFSKIYQDSKTFKTFIAFILEKNKEELKGFNITVDNKTQTLYDVFHKEGGSNQRLTKEETGLFTRIKNLVNVVGKDFKAIESEFSVISGQQFNEEGLKVKDYSGLITSVLSLLDDLTSDEVMALFNTSGSKNLDEISNVLSKVNQYVKYAEAVEGSIQNKDYTSVVVESVSFLEKLLGDNSKLESNRYVLEFMKYASLAANLASAETAEEMAEAINASILPVGSYRVKRNSYFSVSVNAYAGLFIGGESLSNDDAKNQLNGLAGFTAPVGIGLNWGLKTKTRSKNTSQLAAKVVYDQEGKPMDKKYFKGSSISLYVSIIDVGAITAFRLQDDETPIDNVQWSNILAPGLYLSYGIKNTPLALNIGGQYGPALRTVEAVDGSANLTVDSRAFRFGVGIVADIPFYNLYSRSEHVEVNK